MQTNMLFKLYLIFKDWMIFYFDIMDINIGEIIDLFKGIDKNCCFLNSNPFKTSKPIMWVHMKILTLCCFKLSLNILNCFRKKNNKNFELLLNHSFNKIKLKIFRKGNFINFHDMQLACSTVVYNIENQTGFSQWRTVFKNVNIILY